MKNLSQENGTYLFRVEIPKGFSQAQTDEVEAFHKKLLVNIDENLPTILKRADDDELRETSIHYRGQMESIRNPSPCEHLTLPELGLETPWVLHENKQMDRLLRKVVVETLQIMRLAIDEELGQEFSKQYDAEILDASWIRSEKTAGNLVKQRVDFCPKK